MQSVVDNLMTSYEKQGKGPVVLLLHGWGDRKETFKNLQKNLSTTYTTIALDLPGFGQTQQPSEVWDLENYAEFVNHFLAKIGVENKLHAVIGHSNGGALAIFGLSRGSLSADKLILLASSGIRTGGGLKRIIFKVIAKVGKVATFWVPERHRKKLRKSLYGVSGSDMLVAPHLQETFKKTVRQDVQNEAAQLKVPTLLIYSLGDRAVPVQDGRRLSSLISNSKLVELSGGDHFVHQTAEAEVMEAVNGFLS